MKKFKSLKYIIISLLLVCSFTLAIPMETFAKTKKEPAQPDYSLIFDAEYYYDKYEDLQKAFGKNPFLLFNHFVTRGMREGRQAKESFNVYGYAANNLDLILKYGYGDLSLYYIHYITEGHKEGRTCNTAYTPSNNSSNDDEDKDENYSGERAVIMDLINQARSSISVGGISRASDLDAAAQDRAKDIAVKFSHYRPNGRYYTQALDAHGVRYSNSYEVITEGDSSAESVFSGWMNNSEIAHNIQSEDYYYVGIGCTQDDDGDYYWVLLLTY